METDTPKSAPDPMNRCIPPLPDNGIDNGLFPYSIGTVTGAILVAVILLVARRV